MLMKRCPLCNRTYFNDEFAFCLADGTLLSPPYDPSETQILPVPNNADLPPTEVFPSAISLYASKETNKEEFIGKRQRWNETSFFEDARKYLKTDEVEKLRQLYRFSIEYADRVTWGTGSRRGTFNVQFDPLSTSKSLYSIYSDGNLDLNFQWLSEDEKSVAVIEKFARELKKLQGFNIPYNFRRKFIRVHKEHWMSKVEIFIKAIRAAIRSGKEGKRKSFDPPPKQITWSDLPDTISLSKWKEVLRKTLERAFLENADFSKLPIKATQDKTEANEFKSPMQVGNQAIYIESNLSASAIRKKISNLLRVMGKPDKFLRIECTDGTVFELP
jgi:hypothetical protein